MELRPYQIEAENKIFEAWEIVQKTLLIACTGSGKTIIMAKLAEKLVRAGYRILILAHRGELLEQAQDKILQATGLGCSIEKAEQTARGEFFRITVGSVQSLMQEKRLAKFSPDYYDYVFVDEAHHVLADSYQVILNHFSNAKVLGVTATADLNSKQNLGEYFDTIAYEYNIVRAIKEKYLVPISVITIPLKIDMTKVRTQGGDYKAQDVDHALTPYMEKIADEIKINCVGRKTVIFTPLIATSLKMKDVLLSKGIVAKEVNGKSKNRTEVSENFTNGKYEVIINSMLYTEGWDCPPVDCIICLRPTKSSLLYRQIIGRGLRLSPETGKKNLLVLDFLWLTAKHDLIRPAHLIAPNDAVAKKMIEKMEEKAGCETADLEQSEPDAESDVIRERESSLAKQLKAQRTKKRKLVDPLQFAFSINSEDLLDYEPAMNWESAPATKKQIQALEKFGIFPEDVQNCGYAGKLLTKLNLRRTEGYSTPKQIRVLEKYGFQKVGEWTFQDCNKLITRIASSFWHVPNDINPAIYVPSGQGDLKL